MTEPRLSRWQNAIQLAVVLGVVILLIGLLLPAVQQAREAARRTQSKNNLKQLGLALYNYHDVFQMFPPGGVFNAEGTAYHGWTTFLAPYLDCSPFYNSINMHVPWDDPSQIERFITHPHTSFLNPSVSPVQSPDGIPLVHYSANQWHLHRNSSRRIQELTFGTSNTLMLADAFGNYPPLGYPCIWRDPELPINRDPDGFGYRPAGLHALLADGAVVSISHDFAAEIHASFAGGKDLRPDPAQVVRPAETYRVQGDFLITVPISFNDDRSIQVGAKVNRAGETKAIKYERVPTKDRWKPITAPLDATVKSFLSRTAIESVDAGGYLSDTGVAQFTALPRLKELEIGGKGITDASCPALANMPSLQSLTLDEANITVRGLAELAKSDTLKSLTIIEPDLDPTGVDALQQMPSLSLLRLEWHLKPVSLTPEQLTPLLDHRPEMKLVVRANGRLYQTDDIRELGRLNAPWKP